MNLVVIFSVLILLVVIGLFGFVYKLSADLNEANKKIINLIETGNKANHNEFKSVNKEITSINSKIKELTKIEEME